MFYLLKNLSSQSVGLQHHPSLLFFLLLGHLREFVVNPTKVERTQNVNV